MVKNEEQDWTEAGSSTGDVWDKEGVLIGVYKAKQTNVGPNDSNMYKIQEDGKDDVTGVWGSTVLDGRFEEIPLGSMVKIECLGEEKSKRGNKFTNYKVLYKAPPKEITDTFPGAEVAA